MHTQVARLRPHEQVEFLWRLSRDAPLAFLWLHERCGPTVELKLLGQRFYSVTAADDIRHVLKDNYRNYGKGTQYTDFEPLWGKSNLLSAHGEDWARQRRACAAPFAPSSAQAYQDVIVRHADAVLSAFEGSLARGEPRLLYDDVKHLVMRALSEQWFGESFGEDAGNVSKLLSEITEFLGSRTFVPLKLPLSVPTPRHLRHQARLRRVAEYARKAMRGTGPANAETNLLGQMLRSVDADSNRRLSDAEVVNNFVVFALAAYETPSLGWTLYHIGRHPHVMAKARAEVKAVLGSAAPTLEHLTQLRYVRMCVDEAMRVNPPAPFLVRTALSSDRLPSVQAQEKDNIVVPTCVVHKLPALWPDPQRFDPERFADRQNLRPFSYLPFGLGARECIGRGLALQFSTTIVSMLLQRYGYELSPDYRPRPNGKFAPYPSGSVPALLCR